MRYPGSSNSKKQGRKYCYLVKAGALKELLWCRGATPGSTVVSELGGSNKEIPQLLSFHHLLSCWCLPFAKLRKSQSVRKPKNATLRGHIAR